MSESLILLRVVFAAWFVWCLAGLAAIRSGEALRGVPKAQRRSVTVLPIIPLFPLAAWGLARLIDLAADPWGTRAVGVAHAAGLVVNAMFVARDTRRLRAIETRH